MGTGSQKDGVFLCEQSGITLSGTIMWYCVQNSISQPFFKARYPLMTRSSNSGGFNFKEGICFKCQPSFALTSIRGFVWSLHWQFVPFPSRFFLQSRQ